MKKKILLDTDIGPDCDDTAALALANMYESAGIIDIMCVTHCTSSPYGVGAIRAVDGWYGHEHAVGTLSEGGFLDGEQYQRYDRALAMSLPAGMRDAEDAVRAMRRALAACGDGEAELIAIGPLKVVAALLDSAPDDVSELNGVELAARKCPRLTLMAGSFDWGERCEGIPHVEWNVEMDVKSARRVVELWPSEMVWCGWELGARVISGRCLAELPAGHPVRRAYELFGSAEGRPSWDLLTVQHACCPDEVLTVPSEPGVVHMDEDGHTWFEMRECGRHRVLRLAREARDIAQVLDERLCVNS